MWRRTVGHALEKLQMCMRNVALAIVAWVAGVRGARLTVDEAGQSMVEYAIVLALVAVTSMIAVEALGGGISQVFTSILGKITGLAR